MSAKLLYKGNVHIYLQGKNALLPQNNTDNPPIFYSIGSRKSLLTITDYRIEPVQAALHILSGKNGFEFADILNQPAWVEIYGKIDGEGLDIELHESASDKYEGILWLGILDNNEMTLQNIEWEVFRSIKTNLTAFAALVKQD